MLSCEFHVLAARELDEAVAHYELIAPGKGLELAEQIEGAISQICAFPESAPISRGTVRSVVVQPSRRWEYTLLGNQVLSGGRLGLPWPNMCGLAKCFLGHGLKLCVVERSLRFEVSTGSLKVIGGCVFAEAARLLFAGDQRRTHGVATWWGCRLVLAAAVLGASGSDARRHERARRPW